VLLLLLVAAFLALTGCSQGVVQSPRPTPLRTVDATDVPNVRPSPEDQPTAAAIDSFGLQRAHWEGVWSARQPGVLGDSDVQTVLMIDGTFSSQSRHVESGALVTTTGEWDIFTIGDRPMLRFAVEDFEPKEWCGPLGCVAIQIPTGQSQYFHFTDRNTVILREPSCESDACEVIYRRG
jgi:hypothetical protein